MSDCKHEKTRITADDGEDVCLICDDVTVETTGDSVTVERN